jgi:hypothetical protein
MRSVELSFFVQAVESRKLSYGITDERIADARNTGERRTPEKREMLARIQQRASARGVDAMPANF